MSVLRLNVLTLTLTTTTITTTIPPAPQQHDTIAVRRTSSKNYTTKNRIKYDSGNIITIMNNKAVRVTVITVIR